MNASCGVPVPRDVHEVIGGGDWSPLPRRGSNALTFRWHGPGRDLFVKAVPRRQGVVDGHEAAALFRKEAQVRLISQEAPALKSVVPGVTVRVSRDHLVLISPFVEGVSPVDLLLAGDVAAFARWMRTVLDVVGGSGYGVRSVVTSTGAAWTLYGGRLQRRLAFTRVALSGGLADDDVQSATRSSAHGLLTSVEHLTSRGNLLPTRLWFPAHGDLNLLNVIVDPRTDQFALVDQRGTCTPWDPAYDLGKLLLSLTIHVGLEYRFLLPGTDRMAEPRSVPSAVPAPTTALMEAGIRELRRAVQSWGFGDMIESRPGHLWRRVLFAHAVHALCESACRVSVARVRQADDRAHEMAKARAYRAYGVRCIDALLAGSDDVPMPTPIKAVRA